MITDGAATDQVEKVAQRLKEEEEKKSVAFFAVGVEGADMSRLGEIVVRTPLKLKGQNVTHPPLILVELSSSDQGKW